MSKRTLTRCDRPGCESEFTGDGAVVDVRVRLPPLGEIGTVTWDLCDRCVAELRRDRLDTDLAFGDRLRSSPPPPEPRDAKEAKS